jgi:hypothetical protein
MNAVCSTMAYRLSVTRKKNRSAATVLITNRRADTARGEMQLKGPSVLEARLVG